MALRSDDKVSSRNFSVSEGSQPPYSLSDMTPSDSAILPNFAPDYNKPVRKMPPVSACDKEVPDQKKATS